MEKILISGLSQAVTAWLKGEEYYTTHANLEWAGGRAVPFPTASLKKLSKKVCSVPIWYLLAC